VAQNGALIGIDRADQKHDIWVVGQFEITVPINIGPGFQTDPLPFNS
jgi:hypothetical protein